MRLEDFPVIKEIWRSDNLGEEQTQAIIQKIEQKTPLLPRFKEADDFHNFLSQCCVSGMSCQRLNEVDQAKVNTVKTEYLEPFLLSTQNLLDQFHKRYS